MKKILISFTTLAFILYFVMGIFLYINQRSFLYHPTPYIATQYKQMTLKNEEENINIIILI